MFCCFGYHQKIVIQTVSLFDYVRLAFGDNLFAKTEPYFILYLVAQLKRHIKPDLILDNSTLEHHTFESLLNSSNEVMATHRAYLQKTYDSWVTN